MFTDYIKTAFVLNLWFGLLGLSNAFLRNFWPQTSAFTDIVYLILIVLFVVLNGLIVSRTLFIQSKTRLSPTLRRMNRSTRIS